ncbi:LolA family protein [Negadavirga shengliensis]|uniref:Outer membrane lipoprotein carrier protein LolA n=1 Tax=Negadavirga shengliensis TaxID=1389218 RepID=A0ABV9T5U4_9BACT
MKIVKIIVFILLISVIPVHLSAQREPSAKEILSRVSEKYQKLNGFRAVFEYTYATEAEGPVQSNVGEVTVKGDKYKLVLDDQEIYNDGKTVWTLIKSNRYQEVTINNVDDETEELTPSNIYNIYKKGYEAELLGEGTLNGTPVYEILLTTNKRSSQFKQIKLFIDKSKNDLLAWEISDDMGGTFKYTFKELKNDVEIMDDYFVFNKKNYQNIEIIDLR